jgi:hypothetical protein
LVRQQIPNLRQTTQQVRRTAPQRIELLIFVHQDANARPVGRSASKAPFETSLGIAEEVKEVLNVLLLFASQFGGCIGHTTFSHGIAAIWFC